MNLKDMFHQAMKVERQMKRHYVSKVCLLEFFKGKRGRRQVLPR